MKKLMRLALLVWALVSLHAQAARPFMTDDARLTTDGSCQLESWTRRYHDRYENWALPACNPTGNFEITAGGGHFKETGAPNSNDYVLQGKSLFRPLTTNDWGWGLAVGQVHHPSAVPGPNNLGNTYAYIPLSISRLNDKLVFHTNLGWSRDRQTGQHVTTWGAGAEFWTSERIMLIGESFGDDHQKPYFQTGVRFSIIPGLLQIDATRGYQYGNTGRNSWTSFGLRFTPDKIF